MPKKVPFDFKWVGTGGKIPSPGFKNVILKIGLKADPFVNRQ